MKRKSILVIEDEQSVRENLEALLQEEQYEVITASNGMDGINKAKKNLPDLIICDVMMPKCNGYEVLDSLSKNKDTLSIPFLFLTAKIEIGDLRKGMELGADDYLLKPYKTDTLLNAISTRLKKFESLKANISQQQPDKDAMNKYEENDRILLTINNEPQFIQINSIVTIKAENQYTNLYLENGNNFLIRKSLTKWESVLPEKTFVRVHRNSIVNLNYISKIEKWFNNAFRLHINNLEEPIMVSKRYSSKIKTSL